VIPLVAPDSPPFPGRSFSHPVQRLKTFVMRSGSTPSCAIAMPPLTDSRYSAINPPRTMKRLMPSITTGLP
jgi:hypothetical protein